MKHLRLVGLYFVSLSVLSLTGADFTCELVGVDLRIAAEAHAKNQGNNNRDNDDNAGGGAPMPWLGGDHARAPEPPRGGAPMPWLGGGDVQGAWLKSGGDLQVPSLKGGGNQVPEPSREGVHVPEPVTLTLLGLGIAGLYVYTRRRR